MRALARGLQGRATQAAEAAAGASFDARVADSLDLIDHGEPAIGLEILAQNVHEFDVPLSRAEYAAFETAGRALNLDPGVWVFLAGLVT